MEGNKYEFLLLLDPTAPCRLPNDVSGALNKLRANPDADGIIGVSQPEFNPIWHCVVEKDGWMSDLMPNAASFTRRQDLPAVYRINSSLYAWRTSFVRNCAGNWRTEGRHLLHEIPESRSIHIDDLDQFQHAELLIREGLVKLPWLTDLK
jgi:CMP-N-acetylneuraminic acid synthetase